MVGILREADRSPVAQSASSTEIISGPLSILSLAGRPH
jgi:hypothetical protein